VVSVGIKDIIQSYVATAKFVLVTSAPVVVLVILKAPGTDAPPASAFPPVRITVFNAIPPSILVGPVGHVIVGVTLVTVTLIESITFSYVLVSVGVNRIC
jgi:hypothetical protein